MWSASIKLVYIVELTVPWESSVEEAYERKRLRYAELAADVEQRGWRATGMPSGSRLQRISSHLNIQATQGDGSVREGPPTGSQRPLQSG